MKIDAQIHANFAYLVTPRSIAVDNPINIFNFRWLSGYAALFFVPCNGITWNAPS